MTWPPRSSRSYFGPAAGGCAGCCARQGEQPGPARISEHRPATTPSRLVISPSAPLRRVAVHVAPRYSPMSSVPVISSPVDLAGERQVERVAVLLAVGAADPHAVAVDRAGDLAGHEVALMRARRDRCPSASGAACESTSRRRTGSARPTGRSGPRPAPRARVAVGCAGGFDSTATSRSAMICSSPAAIMYGVTETPVCAGCGPPRAASA